MGNVKRYDSYGYDGLSGLMKEHADGDWVRSEEFDALRAENERLRKVTHVMIPTDTMEQEFAKYHRRGFDAGIKQGLAENAELVGLMRNMLRALPTTRCADLHHSKADQHAYNEVCKPLERYMTAQLEIEGALAKHRGE